MNLLTLLWFNGFSFFENFLTAATCPFCAAYLPISNLSLADHIIYEFLFLNWVVGLVAASVTAL